MEKGEFFPSIVIKVPLCSLLTLVWHVLNSYENKMHSLSLGLGNLVPE